MFKSNMFLDTLGKTTNLNGDNLEKIKALLKYNADMVLVVNHKKFFIISMNNFIRIPKKIFGTVEEFEETFGVKAIVKLSDKSYFTVELHKPQQGILETIGVLMSLYANTVKEQEEHIKTIKTEHTEQEKKKHETKTKKSTNATVERSVPKKRKKRTKSAKATG